MSGFHVLYKIVSCIFVSWCQMGHILTYPEYFYEFISNLIHLYFVVELTYVSLN
jgi:hypothetical protein